MAIYDVVPFSNELDLLGMRLGILDPYVDYFVISEATTTFSGRPKLLHFAEARERFAPFADKIIHTAVTDDIDGSPFDRDRFQKDRIRGTLDEHCSGDDIIIFSDVDEIPNPKTLERAFDAVRKGRMAHFAQNLYYYYLNLLETTGKLPSITGDYAGVKEGKWLGSRAASFDYVRGFTMTELREPGHKATGERIPEGGWHFSYCGGLDDAATEDRVRVKVAEFAHQELVNDRTMRKLSSRIAKGKDPFGRRGSRFRKVPIDDSYPDFLLRNLDRYAHMVLT